MVVNLVYYAALALIAASCAAQYTIKFRFGQKFERLRTEQAGAPPMTYAQLFRFAPEIGISPENFDKPVRFVLAVPSDTLNRREVLKLVFLCEKLKSEGFRYEFVFSEAPELKTAACLVFERNKYKFRTFPAADKRIYWKYPRFPELAGNEELVESCRRVRRCILNFYHRNKFRDDLFFGLFFEFFGCGREEFLRGFARVLASSTNVLNRESEGLLVPMTEDEQGMFFALSLYHLTALHIDLAAEEGECVAETRAGRLESVLRRERSSLSDIFFPLLENYFAGAEQSDLKSFNYLCALRFRERFHWQAVSFQKRIADDDLLFFLRFSDLPPAEALEAFHERARMLRHNQPEQADFFSACTLWLVFLSKILKVNVAGDRVYFGAMREALPLRLGMFSREIDFELSDTACANNSFSLRSSREKFTIYVT